MPTITTGSRVRAVPTTTPSVCIGIDPGLSGAIAFLDRSTGRIVSVWDMPLFDGHRGQEVDTKALERILFSHPVVHSVTIEDVHGRPGNSCVSLFNFGQAYGALKGTLHTMGLPFKQVNPATWQKVVFSMAGITEQHDTKKASVFVALKLHPEAGLVRGGKRAHKPDHNRADAVCIAHYSAWLATTKKDSAKCS